MPRCKESTFLRAWQATVWAALAGLLCAVSTSGLQFAPADSKRTLTVWTVPSLDRVGLHDSPGNSRSFEMFAARGEYQSFQVALQVPPAGLSDTTVEIGDFRDDHGGLISRSHATIFREHYVHVPRSSPNWKGANQPLGPGWFADGLIPLKTPVRLDAGVNQPFWIDVYVPRDASPGHYTTSVRIDAAEGSATIPVGLRVWRFEVPVKPNLLSSFGYTGELRLGVAEMLLQHRVMPQRISPCRGDREPCPLNVPTERKLINQFGLAAVDAGFWSGASYGNCEMAPPPGVRELRRALSAHDKTLLLYNFTADEIESCAGLVPMIQSWARNLHAAGIKNLMTQAPDPSLLDDGSGHPAVDISVMTPLMYDKALDQLPAARKKGVTFWSYNASVQDAYSPKWQIDFLPINYRIQPGFLSQSLNLTGILYWRSNQWMGSPWRSAIDNTGHFAPAASYPGEGFLLYPADDFGDPGGVLPSMRLKQIRDGVTDYDYIQTLKQMGREQWVLPIVRSIGADWSHWTQDSARLLAARQKIGAEIDRLSISARKPASRKDR